VTRKGKGVLSDYLASSLFRFVALPLGAAGVGVIVKLTVALVKRHSPGPEVFSVWVELMIGSLFNLVGVATEVARKVSTSSVDPATQSARTDFLLQCVVGSSVIIFLLWLVAIASVLPAAWTAPGGPRTQAGKTVRFVWEQLVPHAIAGGVLVAVLAFGSEPPA
jgi:hypothetical protein